LLIAVRNAAAEAHALDVDRISSDTARLAIGPKRVRQKPEACFQTRQALDFEKWFSVAVRRNAAPRPVDLIMPAPIPTLWAGFERRVF